MQAVTEKQQAREIFDLHLKSLIKNIDIHQKVNCKLLAKEQSLISIGLMIEMEKLSGLFRSAVTIDPMEPQQVTVGGQPAPKSFWKGVLNEIENI